MKRTMILAVAIGLIGCGNASTEAVSEINNNTNTHPAVATALSVTDFSEVAAMTIDAVVHIQTEQTQLTPLYQSFFGFIINQGVRKQTYNAYGSGVIISTDGYIVTNNHVVQDAEKITVTLNDKRTLPAVLVGNDPATDLAVIKIDAKKLTYIPFGDSDSARIGQPVLAVGNPFNLTSTVTAGIISAKARNMGIIENTRGMESPIESFIQTDAAVNSGNSGGALVDGNAKLIGIVTAIASGDGYYTGYSFAIPANLAQKVTSDLIQYGYVQRAYMGIEAMEMTQQTAGNSDDVRGVLIARIAPGCAADRAGLHPGDVILKIGKHSVNSYAEMMEELGKHNPGDTVAVEYMRDGKTKTANATLLNSKGTTEIIKR